MKCTTTEIMPKLPRTKPKRKLLLVGGVNAMEIRKLEKIYRFPKISFSLQK